MLAPVPRVRALWMDFTGRDIGPELTLKNLGHQTGGPQMGGMMDG